MARESKSTERVAARCATRVRVREMARLDARQRNAPARLLSSLRASHCAHRHTIAPAMAPGGSAYTTPSAAAARIATRKTRQPWIHPARPWVVAAALILDHVALLGHVDSVEELRA